MKKLLTIAMMTAAVSALAVESSNTFGILRVDSTAAQTIVSVPWLAAGGGDINVADIVKTANLSEGDQLFYYDGTEYKAWVLTSGSWTAANSSYMGEDGESNTVYAGDQSHEIVRGKAIILVRSNPGSCFYLYGQYTDSGATTTVSRSDSGLTYALIAPTATSEVTVNTPNWTGVETGDMIYLANGKPLYWDATTSKWCTKAFDPTTKKNVLTEYSTNLTLGTGFWLCVGNGTGNVTVEW